MIYHQGVLVDLVDCFTAIVVVLSTVVHSQGHIYQSYVLKQRIWAFHICGHIGDGR